MLLTQCLLFAGLASTLSTANHQIDQTVTVGIGNIHGNPRNDAGILAFQGIPYAAAPVGALRWKAPQPPPQVRGTFNATAYGSRCLSALSTYQALTTQSEDCQR